MKKKTLLPYVLTTALIIQAVPLGVLGYEGDISSAGSELEIYLENIEEGQPTENGDKPDTETINSDETEEFPENYTDLAESLFPDPEEEFAEIMPFATGYESEAPAPSVYIGNGYQEYSWTKWPGAPSAAGDQTFDLMLTYSSGYLNTGETRLLYAVMPFRWRSNMTRVGLTIYYIDNPNSTNHYLVPLQYGGASTNDSGFINFTLQGVSPGGYSVQGWYEDTSGRRHTGNSNNVFVYASGTPATITPSYVELEIGKSQRFTNDIFKGLTGPKGEDYNAMLVNWTNSDNTIMSFVSSGSAATGTALKAGTTYVTASSKDGEISAICQVVVKAPEVLPTGVTISPNTPQTINTGATLQLSKTITPNNATNTAVTWTSSNTSVAKVHSTSGLVTAVSPGTATITVKTHNNKTATLNITVVNPVVNPESVTLTPSTPQTLDLGQTIQISAQVLPANVTNDTLTWSSDNENIITISGSGNTRTVTAVGSGSATVTASTHNNKSASVNFTVPEQPVTEVKIQPANLTLEVNGAYELEALLTPANPSNQSVTWASSDTSIVTVSGNGPKADITAVGTGTAVITALSHNGKMGIATIEVIAGVIAVESFSLNPASTSVGVGNIIEVSPVFTPSGASNKNFDFIISDPSKVEVSKKSDGTLEVKGLAAGYSAIIATAEDGGFIAFSNITVTESPTVIPVESISLNKTTLSLGEGQTEQLQVTFNPANATNKNLEWTSSDPSKVIVAQNGNVTGVTEGNAIIFVKSVDGNHADMCTVTVSGTTNPQPSGNLALTATASSNSVLNTNRAASKANDADYDSSWLALANDYNVYLELDFGSEINFNELVIYEVGSRIGNYDIEVWDGANWISVYSGYRIGAAGHTITLGDQRASKVRIQIFDRYNNNPTAYGIAEFEVYNR